MPQPSKPGRLDPQNVWRSRYIPHAIFGAYDWFIRRLVYPTQNTERKRTKAAGVMTTALDIAHWFAGSIDREAGDSITHLKVQKLVYYAQAWSLALSV